MGLIDNKDVTLYVKSDDGSFIELGYIPKLPINVVGVVFCKDCKQWDAELGCCTSYTIVKCTDGREGVSSEEDDFCSRGEKKDD